MEQKFSWNKKSLYGKTRRVCKIQLQKEISHHIPIVKMKHYYKMKLHQKIEIMSNLKNLKLINAIGDMRIPKSTEAANRRK